MTLIVPGLHEGSNLGPYSLVEPVDRTFLEDHFRTDKGPLVRPQGFYCFDFIGDDWKKYPGPNRPMSEPSSEEARRLIEFVRLDQSSGDEEFRREIDSHLDVDEFLRFMAVRAKIANADGFFTVA